MTRPFPAPFRFMAGLGCAVALWVGTIFGSEGVAGRPTTAPDRGRIGFDPATPPEMQWAALPFRAPEPSNNIGTELRVALGALLFFDPILSSTRKVSCATCHDPRFGWSDGRSTPVGVGGVGSGPSRMRRSASAMPVRPFNTPTVLNVGFNGLVTGRGGEPGEAPMFWDARVQGLERQALIPMQTLGEMREDDCPEGEAVHQAVLRVRSIAEYRGRFREAFGDGGEAVTAAHLAEAIAAFERSLVTPNTPFDRFLRGDDSALNAEQQRGLRLFQSAGCTQCHGGPMLSDFKLHFIGVADPTVHGRRPFRTPTLRQIGRTAPYMHNGSLRTLREVLVFYEALEDVVSETLDGGDSAAEPRLDPLLRRLSLAPDDFPALEAFLATLESSDEFPGAPSKVPSGLPVLENSLATHSSSLRP